MALVGMLLVMMVVMMISTLKTKEEVIVINICEVLEDLHLVLSRLVSFLALFVSL